MYSYKPEIIFPPLLPPLSSSPMVHHACVCVLDTEASHIDNMQHGFIHLFGPRSVIRYSYSFLKTANEQSFCCCFILLSKFWDNNKKGFAELFNICCLAVPNL